jgi:hypothetical protein
MDRQHGRFNGDSGVTSGEEKKNREHRGTGSE